MTLALFFALLLGGVAPESKTAWMEPARFGLEVGMTRADAEKAIGTSGLETKEGKEPHHLLVEVAENRTITLDLEGGTLRSIRFELVDFLPEIRAAWKEGAFRLQSRHGAPTRRTERPMTLAWIETDPQIYVFASTEKQGAFGEQGLGFLVIRYAR